MMFVRQIYAGWIGVMNDTHCTSGVCTFELNKARLDQLEQTEPTLHELNALYADLKLNVIHDKHGFKSYVKSITKERQHE